ncbi:hypothetical protein BE20_15380 [Sorangium cellulosum]|nr:hypothetical protein BE20_15380 [Sorangium cellulosum]
MASAPASSASAASTPASSASALSAPASSASSASASSRLGVLRLRVPCPRPSRLRPLGLRALRLLDQPLPEPPRVLVLRIALEDLVEHGDRPVRVPLRRVDLGERRRGPRRRRGRRPLLGRGLAAQRARGLRHVQAALDNARQQIARPPEEAAQPGPLRLPLRGARQDLVDELGLREHARPRHPEALGARYQLLPRQPVELPALHRRGRYHIRRAPTGARPLTGRRPPPPDPRRAARAARARPRRRARSAP